MYSFVLKCTERLGFVFSGEKALPTSNSAALCWAFRSLRECLNVSVKFFYYSDVSELDTHLDTLFEQALTAVYDELKNSGETQDSRSRLLIRIRHYVGRMQAYAADIAAARGGPPPELLGESQIYARLVQTHEKMAGNARELKPLILSFIKNGHFYPSESNWGPSIVSPSWSCECPATACMTATFGVSPWK